MLYNTVCCIIHRIGEIIISNKQRRARHKQWIIKRNRKSLRLRSNNKAFRKKHLFTSDKPYGRIQNHFSYDNKNKDYRIKVPLKFGFVINAEETSSFFNGLLKFIFDRRNHGKKVFIDISKINELTIDALMYLIAIIRDSHNSILFKNQFCGNVPENKNVRSMFENSGFYDYVVYNGTIQNDNSSECVKIVSGCKCENTTAQQITDFFIEKTQLPIKCARFIYVMMIELMSNTFKHAYNSKRAISSLQTNWYCYANYDNNDTISFTFMDTGDGIPSTVRKNFPEKLDILKMKTDDKYVVSALNGDFRTSTNQFNRGKGLPKIREICSAGIIQNLKIFTNKAAVRVYQNNIESNTISPLLKGTLYYWEVSISNLKGDKQ